jgi:PAS domain S-box-containing protein
MVEQLARAALAETEDRVWATLQLAAVGIAHLGIDGRWLFANRKLCDMLGYSADRLQASTLQDVTHARDHAIDAKGLRRLSAGDIPSYSTSRCFIRRDGTDLWCELTIARLPLDTADGPVCFAATIQDVSKRFAALASMQASEMVLSAIGASTPDLVFAKDRQGRLLYANAATLAVLGRSADDALGRTDLDMMMHRSQAIAIMDNDRRVMARGEPETVEEVVAYAVSGGIDRIWLATKSPMRDADGAIIGVAGVARDVTAERAAAMALAAAKQRLDIVLEGAGLGSWHWHIPSGHIELDDRWAAILGYGLSDLKALTGVWDGLVHPGDLQSRAERVAAHFEARTPIYESEHRLRHKSGRWVWVLERGRVVGRDAAGRPLVATGTLLDITARREAEAALVVSEERLALASGAARMGVWDWEDGAVGGIINAEFRAIHGLAPDDPPFLTMEAWFALVHPEDRDRVRNSIRDAMHTRAEFRQEYRILRADTNELRWVAARGRRVDTGGRPCRIIGVSYDDTDRRREQERQVLLAREVDHRAKNILAVVASIVRLTRAEDPKRFAEGVEARISALARVHTLLARDRWTGAALAEMAKEELAAFHRRDRVTISGPELRLRPDAVQPISMVLHELATNAVRHGALSGSHGSVELCWRVAAADTLGKQQLLLWWVERDGPPIVGPPSRRGFGTTLMHATIHGQLGGRLRHLWKNAGLQCEIALPTDRVLNEAAPATGSPPPKAVKARASGPNPGLSLRGRRILVVEDEPAIALATVNTLERLGCEVVGPVGTLQQGLAVAEAEQARLDAALLDVNLGGEVSFPIAELLAKSGVPFAHVTGYGEPPARHDRAEPPALWLTKPIVESDLTLALQALLQQRRNRSGSPGGSSD